MRSIVLSSAPTTIYGACSRRRGGRRALRRRIMFLKRGVMCRHEIFIGRVFAKPDSGAGDVVLLLGAEIAMASSRSLAHKLSEIGMPVTKLTTLPLGDCAPKPAHRAAARTLL